MKCTRNGNMDTDEFALGLLELRNSPRVEGQSPAQILFGHPIRSIIPVHKRAYAKEWQQSKTITEEKREKARKYAENRYNLTAKPLPEFKVGSYVNIQDPKTGRWIETGKICQRMDEYEVNHSAENIEHCNIENMCQIPPTAIDYALF